MLDTQKSGTESSVTKSDMKAPKTAKPTGKVNKGEKIRLKIGDKKFEVSPDESKNGSVPKLDTVETKRALSTEPAFLLPSKKASIIKSVAEKES